MPAGAAEATTVAKGNAVAAITRIAAQRVIVRVGRFITEALRVLTATAMTAVTASGPRLKLFGGLLS